MKAAVGPDFQTTLAGQVQLQGKGLHTGVHAQMALLPAPAGQGVVFRRTDLPGKPEVPAALELVTATERGTVLSQGASSAATVEHLLGALYGMGVDNVTVELSGPEVPILDGSAAGFVDLIQKAGLRRLEALRLYFDVEAAFAFDQDGKRLQACPAPALELFYAIDYGHRHLGAQTAAYRESDAAFAGALAPARTFCFESEVEAMRKAGLIKGGDRDCALVIGEQGLINGPLRFEDEFARHKMLDFLGDLSLIGRRVRGSFQVERGGHGFHVEAFKALKLGQGPGHQKRSKTMTETNATLMDSNEIQAQIPHRYPFLLIDRITGMVLKRSVTGLKNVSANEWFFQGHFPGHPIMPGVLIVEGMAQCGGVLIVKSYPELQGKMTYFMGIDSVRFRRPVVPGDTLRYEVEILKVKGPVSRLKGLAYVGDELATEAEFMCMVVGNDKEKGKI